MAHGPVTTAGTVSHAGVGGLTLGGGRLAPDATAFAHRESSHNMLSFMAWRHGDDPSEHIADIKRYWSNIEPFTRGFYSNDVFDETQAQINANYRQNFPRLLEVKKRYDPGNLFRLNANIAPG